MPTVVLSGVGPSAASAADRQSFDIEARRLRDLGYRVPPRRAAHSDGARRRLFDLGASQILALMPGWQRSPECLLEIQIAQRIGLDVIESRCLCAPLPADIRDEQPKPGRLMTDAEGDAAVDRLRWLRVDRQL